MPIADIVDAVRRYKVGVTEDPWQKIDRPTIRNATDFIRRRVKGQDHAVTHMLDIVKRAVPVSVGGQAWWCRVAWRFSRAQPVSVRPSSLRP